MLNHTKWVSLNKRHFLGGYFFVIFFQKIVE
jgi:hypothetical protein